jgi:hypothetical protein
MDVDIKLRYSSPRFANSVMSALTPDNLVNGTKLRISTRTHGRELEVAVTNCERIETLQATVQDIFRCVRAAESSLARISGEHKSSGRL